MYGDFLFFDPVSEVSPMHPNRARRFIEWLANEVNQVLI
jgi:hypothetical protein